MEAQGKSDPGRRVTVHPVSMFAPIGPSRRY